jgi:hypothetical protein
MNAEANALPGPLRFDDSWQGYPYKRALRHAYALVANYQYLPNAFAEVTVSLPNGRTINISRTLRVSGRLTLDAKTDGSPVKKK